jgi:hypothetical protein
MRRGWSVLLLMVAVACGRTFHGTAVQPNPVAQPTETLRSSERITIVTGDMELSAPNASTGVYDATPAHGNHWPLINQASFTIVSRDRLRFHVQIDHKWEDWADLSNWSVKLVDDRGRSWEPESIDHARVGMITKMWDREIQTAICDVDSAGQPQINARGDCLAPTRGISKTDQTSGWQRRQTLGSLSIYRGKADFVFYQRELFTRDVRWLKLTIKHGELAFEFLWRFEDSVASAD